MVEQRFSYCLCVGFGRNIAHSRKKFLTDLHRRENEAGLSSGGQLFKGYRT